MTFGDLVLVPWQLAVQGAHPEGAGHPWRAARGPAPLARLQHGARRCRWRRASRPDDHPAVHVGELHWGSIRRAPVTRVPDTPANRQAFGSSVIRRRLGALPAGPSTCWPAMPPPAARWRWSRGPLPRAPKAEGEQALLDAMLTEYPGASTSDRILVLDRNFPGSDRVARMLATGTHVLIRVKS